MTFAVPVLPKVVLNVVLVDPAFCEKNCRQIAIGFHRATIAEYHCTRAFGIAINDVEHKVIRIMDRESLKKQDTNRSVVKASGIPKTNVVKAA